MNEKEVEMSQETTYEPEILNRYGLKPSELIGTDHNQNTNTITLFFKNGKRLFLTPKIRCIDSGIYPQIEITFIGSDNFPGGSR